MTSRQAITFLIIGLTLMSCSRAELRPQIADPGTTVSESYSSFLSAGGQRWTYTVSSEYLASEPTWGGPGSGPAPLSLDDAVLIAKQEVHKYFPGSPEPKVAEVEMHSLCCPDRWFYVIGFGPLSRGEDLLAIPVLFSGKAIELTLETEQRKR